MTIIARGHVESLAIGHKGKFAVTIIVDSARMLAPLVIEASPEELAKLYEPGTMIELQIRPIVAQPAKGDAF